MPVAEGQDVQVWQRVFQELIHQVRPWHQWTLTLDNSLMPNTLQPGWTQYQQQVFARFTCSWCSRNWASAHVQVLCHMHWNKRESTGQVKMRVFAQRCQKCSEPPFEVPEFTEENVSRILNNLVFRILKKCYGEGFKSMEKIPTIKDISLKGPHDTDNCEACLQGFCAQCELDLVKPPTMSPSLPTTSTPTFGVPIDRPLSKSSTVVDAVTGHTGVKKGGVVHSPWYPEPTQAQSPRANTNYWEERIVRSSTTLSAVTADTGVKKGGVVHNPWYPEPTQAQSPRANTNYWEERIVRSSTTLSAVTADTGVKKGGVVHNHGLPELPQAQSPRANTSYRTESIIRSSTTVGAVTVDTRVKKGKVVHHPWYPEAKSPREVSTVRSSTTVGASTGHTRVKTGRVVHNPRVPEPPPAKSPRANTSHRAESIVEVYSPRAGLDCHSTQNGRCCNLGICCCSVILILITVVVVVVIVKTII